MLNEDRDAETVFRLIVMQKIAHDLKTFFGTEPQLPPRLQLLVRTLEERQQQNP